MRELYVGENEAGMRLDRLLGRYLNQAGMGFLFRMMRKKNILLNGKKCTGSERLAAGDVVRLYLAEDTIEKFRKTQKVRGVSGRLDIVWEDRHILLINKPAGMLSQKAGQEDVSLVEHVIAYLTESGQLTEAELASFRPSVCNRLDRNTSGLVAAGKTRAGLALLSALIRDRKMKKEYLCIAAGEPFRERTACRFLEKG